MNSATISSSWLSDGSRGGSGAGSLTLDFFMSSLRFLEAVSGGSRSARVRPFSKHGSGVGDHDRHQPPHGAAVRPARAFARRAETMADLTESQVHEILPAHDLTFPLAQFLHGLL